MATRKDVADLAGVSPAVVSYVLNNSNYVSEEKRRAVLDAVRELDYQPNYIGKSLKEKKTYNLGLICDDIRSELFAEIAFYSERYAFENGYKLFLCMSHREPEFLKSMVNHRLDGIFLGTSIYSPEQINWIAQRKVPVVLYQARHYRNLDSSVKCLEIDYYRAAYLLTQRLIQKGFKRIAFFPPYLSGLSYLGDDDYRFKGYKDALQAGGYSFDKALVCYENQSYESICARAEQICRQNLEAYGQIAYVAGNDYNAIQIMRHLKKNGLYDRAHVAIVGMDNTASSEIVSPSLTTIGFSKKDVAREAIEFLVHGSRERCVESVRIPVTLIEGESG